MNSAVGRWFKAGALLFIAMLIVAGCEGPAGVAGAKGVQGDPGEQGPKGDSGLGVVSIVPVTEDGTITLTITLTSGDPVVLTIPSGTDGTAGTAGRGIESVTSSGPDENGVLTITITYDDGSDPTVLTVTLPGQGAPDYTPLTVLDETIDPVIISDMAGEMDTSEESIDLAKHFHSSGMLMYAVMPATHKEVMISVADSMLTVSLKEGAAYANHTFMVKATDERDVSRTLDFSVRRNRMPMKGTAPAVEVTVGTQKPVVVSSMLATMTDSRVTVNNIRLGIYGNMLYPPDGEGIAADVADATTYTALYHFLDDPGDKLTLRAISLDSAMVSAVTDMKGLSITGKKGSTSETDTVGILVKAEDADGLESDNGVFITVSVDAAPSSKIPVPVQNVREGATTASIVFNLYIDDADHEGAVAVDALTFQASSMDPDVAYVEGSTDNKISIAASSDASLAITALKEGDTTIMVTATDALKQTYSVGIPVRVHKGALPTG